MEKISFIKAIGLMWKRIFDYSGKSTRAEFWFPFVFQAGLAVIAALLLTLQLTTQSMNYGYLVPLGLITLYFAVAVIPWISLTIRRLHDTGKSGWWYCLVFAVGIGFMLLLVMCASAGSAIYTTNGNLGGFFPEMNENPCVYGPPPMDVDINYEDPTEESSEEESTEETEPSESSEEAIIESEEASDEEDESDKTPELIDQGSFEPIDNENVCMYGPPDMLERINDEEN